MATRNGIVGRTVYDKKRGLMGRVIKEDGLQITIEFDDGELKQSKAVSPNTFKRWYRLLDEEPDTEPETDSEQAPGGCETNADDGASAAVKKEYKFPAGEPGVGTELATYFRSTIQEYANQDLLFTSAGGGRIVVVKYNGRNVFEVTVCKRRINVLCHKKSLSPDNLARATKVFPDDYGWPLSVQFTFTKLDESSRALIQCIVTDGLYYRQIVEEEK